jgi:hypothetical protein
MVGVRCFSSKVLNKLTPDMPCGIYGALADAGCGVMGMTVVGGSGVHTLVGATSLECNIGVTLGDGSWMRLIIFEHRGVSEGEPIGVWNCCGGLGV